MTDRKTGRPTDGQADREKRLERPRQFCQNWENRCQIALNTNPPEQDGSPVATTSRKTKKKKEIELHDPTRSDRPQDNQIILIDFFKKK